MPRIPLISPESDLSPVQRRVVEGILGKRGGRIPGPYRFGLHCPEMTALIGYYSMVAMTILAHEMPLQEGARPLLPKRR